MQASSTMLLVILILVLILALVLVLSWVREPSSLR